MLRRCFDPEAPTIRGFESACHPTFQAEPFELRSIAGRRWTHVDYDHADPLQVGPDGS